MIVGKRLDLIYIYIYTQTHTDMHISFGSMGKGMGLRVGSLDNFLDMFYSNFPHRGGEDHSVETGKGHKF